MINNIIFLSFLLLNFFVLYTNTTNIKPLITKSKYSFIELTKQSDGLSHFTDSLREEHVN